MRAYKLFRHRDKQHVICAVPEDRAAPGFLAEKTWESSSRKLAEPTAAPIGFSTSWKGGYGRRTAQWILPFQVFLGGGGSRPASKPATGPASRLPPQPRG